MQIITYGNIYRHVYINGSVTHPYFSLLCQIRKPRKWKLVGNEHNIEARSWFLIPFFNKRTNG